MTVVCCTVLLQTVRKVLKMNLNEHIFSHRKVIFLYFQTNSPLIFPTFTFFFSGDNVELGCFEASDPMMFSL